MLWKIRTQATISVPAENVVAITNGGGIRATVKAGDVTKKDINTVLPFGQHAGSCLRDRRRAA